MYPDICIAEPLKYIYHILLSELSCMYTIKHLKYYYCYVIGWVVIMAPLHYPVSRGRKNTALHNL